jgi:ABC-2 type transport system ATP-binding protein
MIEVQELCKEYGQLVAVDGISFTAREGEIFGLLGPNGAGKSTTLHCISGLLRPDGGRVRVLGHDVVREPRRARAALGIVPQELALYEDLSARQNLAYWGEAYGLRGPELARRVDAVLEQVGLAERSREKVARYSGGMKRRLNFGCGIVHGPRVLLLDEPTVGVDPQSRVRLLELVREEARAGISVLYTTHYMEEAEDLCDRLAIVDGGRIMALGTLEELRGRTAERDLLRLSGTFDPRAAREALVRLADVEVVSAEPDLLMLAMEGATRKLTAVFAALAEAGADVRETTLSQPSLESLFIELTGRELRE